MKKTIPEVKSSPFPNLPVLKKCKYLLLASIFCASFFTTVNASHYRYGNISWSLVSGRTVTFKASAAYRSSYGYNAPIVVGSQVYVSDFYFGDGVSEALYLTVTSVNTTDDWFYGEFTTTHTYASDGPFTASTESCCRLSSLQNNADQNYRSETIVVFGTGDNSPVSSSPPILNVQVNQAPATFQVQASDPDGDPLTYELANSFQMGGGTVQPFGLSVDAATGLASFITTGYTVGNIYNAAFYVTDNEGASTMIDVIIRIVSNTSMPPEFDYAITPANGFVYDVIPGNNISFNVRASDVDAGDIVKLSAIGLPPAAVLTPVLPINGNPVSVGFSWTTTYADLGSRIVTFIAEDLSGVQTTTSVVLTVSDPIFDVPPTPALGTSAGCAKPGQPFVVTVQASTTNLSNTVRITAATSLAGASYSNAVPTPAGITTSTVLTFTPAVSQWGIQTFNYTVTDNLGRLKNHSFNIFVNSQPSFTSSPVLTASAGVPYTYNIAVADADIPYGDEIADIHADALPAWLTLTHVPGATTATLSGTPTLADIGVLPISLEVEDLNHDCYHPHAGQDFNITITGNVPVCTPTSILYVNAAANPGGSGGTWLCAIKELRDAIAIANTNPAITQIWVAKGTYKATAGISRTASMTVSRANLKILGGFAGNEVSAAAANINTNPTIISGDIGMANDATDNSYHLLRVTGVPAAATGLLINGFLFEKGYANGTVPSTSENAFGGAAIFYGNNPAASITISKCGFSANTAATAGGAVALYSSNVMFDSCLFITNTSANAGAVAAYQSSPTFSKCLFTLNTATAGSGGAVFALSGTTSFSGSAFDRNSATVSGGGVHQQHSSSVYKQCVFSGNTSATGGGIFQQQASSQVTNSTFFGNIGTTTGGAIALNGAGASTTTRNSIFWKNKRAAATTGAGSDFALLPGSGTGGYNSNLLQSGTSIAADNGGTISNNLRGIDPLFVNEALPAGADGYFIGGTDGLQLSSTSPAKNVGTNAYAAGITLDIQGLTRIVCTTVDLGAYENQGCPLFAKNIEAAPVKATAGIQATVTSPFSSTLQIRYAGAEKAEASVLSFNGKKMAVTGTIVKGVTSVNTATWAPGLYEVVLRTSSGKTMSYKTLKL